MEFSRIDLSCREYIERIRCQAGYTLLSHSFYTLFLWQEIMRLSIYREEDFFVVRYGLAGENSYFCPCGNMDKTKKWIEEQHTKKGFQLFYIDETRKDWLQENFPDVLQLEYDRGSCEYIFDRQEHLLKQGKKYQRIRRELHHLASDHRLRTERLTEENLDVSRRVIEGWQAKNVEEKVGLITEDVPVAECAIQYFTPLGLKGVLVYVDEKPAATAIGCEITQDTYGIQVAKMCERIEGLMFYLLEQMFALVPEQYTYINGDDDMNIEGIRIHKQKMKPVLMNEVWKAYAWV